MSLEREALCVDSPMYQLTMQENGATMYLVIWVGPLHGLVLWFPRGFKQLGNDLAESEVGAS
jgi:hypothetical protein